MSEKIRGFGGWLVKTFVKGYGDNCNDPKVRGRCGVLAGIVGICCNTLLCIAKILIGFISGSLAITADGVNNLSDAASSIMTLLCFHISQKPPDDEHPYGHARVEYLSGLAVAALILIVGFQLAKESVGKIIDPSPVAFSCTALINCFTTLKLTSASSNAIFTSRSAAFTSASVSRPLLFRFLNTF